MVDFTTYQPPSVFVEEDLSTLVSVAGVQPTVVALVGPGRGYRLGSETIIIPDTDPLTLIPTGVDQSTVVVAGTDGTVYTITTDYTLQLDPADNDYTQILREGTGAIVADQTLFITYQYTELDYYEPIRVFDFDDVVDAFGPPLDLTTGDILSPLTFAAKIAFNNGARELILVATIGDAGVDVQVSELVSAYVKLEAVFDVSVIVPLPVGITGSDASPGDTYTVGQDLQTHVEAMNDEDLFRIGIVGYEFNVTILPVTASGNFSSKRMVLAWPPAFRFYHGFSNTTHTISGYYLAVAYAGRLANNPIQEPLTKKRVNGFNGIPAATLATMTNTAKNSWSSGGVAVTELTRGGVLQIRHGVTTDMSSSNTREISLVRARDSLIELVQSSVDGAGLVGTWIDGDTPGQVKSVVAGALEAAVTSDLIVAYNDLKARQLTGDPSVIEVKFQYKPAYPLNYIVISFSINTETGETTVNENEGA